MLTLTCYPSTWRLRRNVSSVLAQAIQQDPVLKRKGKKKGIFLKLKHDSNMKRWHYRENHLCLDPSQPLRHQSPRISELDRTKKVQKAFTVCMEC